MSFLFKMSIILNSCPTTFQTTLNFLLKPTEPSNKRPKLEVEESKKEDSGKDAETKDAAPLAAQVAAGKVDEANRATESGKDDNKTGDTEVKIGSVAGADGSQATNAAASAPLDPALVAPEGAPHSTVANTSGTAATATAPAPSVGTIPGGLPPPVDPNAAATVVNPESIVEERGEVSPLYVGRVIGKGGEMIRDLQARSGCRMDVDQNVPPGQPRVVTYRGTRKTVDFAKRLVQMLCAENASEADLPLGEAKREFLVVPAQSVGKIIGRGGEMIRELQSRSQAKIQVDHTGASGLDPSEKQVTITATEQSVAKAKEMVLFLVANPLMDAMQAINMLVEDKVHRGGVWGSGPPYPNLPNGGQNMQPSSSGGYGYEQGGYYGAAPGAGHGYAAPPAAAPYGAPPTGYGAPAPAYQQQAPAPAAYGQYGAAGGGVEMETFYAAKNFMGRIIGQKGVTINDLQRRSACDIQINQDVPPGQDCEISIRGSRQGIEMVKQMLREIIEIGKFSGYCLGMKYHFYHPLISRTFCGGIGPNHPYAGGRKSLCSLSTI